MRLKRLLPLLAAAALLFCGCGADKVDPDAEVAGNATSRVTADDNTFDISGETITMNGETLAKSTGADEEKLFVLGGRVYFNTPEGARYVFVKNGKIKKVGKGRVVYAKGEWLYYNNADLYMINVNDGRQQLLHQRDLAAGQPLLSFDGDDGDKIWFTDGEKRFYIKKNGTALTEE